MYKLAVISTCIGAAIAQIPGLPECAQNCITDFGGCNSLDVRCICSNQALLEQWSCCVGRSCDGTGALDVGSFIGSICGSEGIMGLPTCPQSSVTAPAPTSQASSSDPPAATPTATTASMQDTPRIPIPVPATSTFSQSATSLPSLTSSALTTSATGSTTTSSAAAESSPGPETQTPTPPSVQAREAMSSGAIAGIAVGSAAGGALLVAGPFFLLRRKRRSQGQDPSQLDIQTHEPEQNRDYMLESKSGQS